MLHYLQFDVVNAFVGELEADPRWRRLFVHAEFGKQVGDEVESLVEAFVVDVVPDPHTPRSIAAPAAAIGALTALHRGYREAGHGFAQLDLVVEAGELRYRFTFDPAVGPRMRGEPDPHAKQRLQAAYAALLAEVAPPPPRPAPATPRTTPGAPLPLQASTREDLAQLVASSLEANVRARAAAVAADREGRPTVARWFRAVAFSHGRAAHVAHAMHGLLPPLASLATAPVAVGATPGNLAATISAEADLAARYGAMFERSTEHPRLTDLFRFLREARERAVEALELAQKWVDLGQDAPDTGPLFICTRCGTIDLVDGGPCFTCELTGRFLEVR